MTDGSPFSTDKKYTVAINSYRGSGGGNHLIKGANIPLEELSKRVIRSTNKNIRYLMMKWIEKKKTVDPVRLNNWKVVPSDWWRKGKERDYKILYGK